MAARRSARIAALHEGDTAGVAITVTPAAADASASTPAHTTTANKRKSSSSKKKVRVRAVAQKAPRRPWQPPLVLGRSLGAQLGPLEQADRAILQWGGIRAWHASRHPAALAAVDKSLGVALTARADLLRKYGLDGATRTSELRDRVRRDADFAGTKQVDSAPGPPRELLLHREQLAGVRVRRVQARVAALESVLQETQFPPMRKNIKGALKGYESGKIPYWRRFTVIYAGKVVGAYDRYEDFSSSEEVRNELLDWCEDRYGRGWLWWEGPTKLGGEDEAQEAEEEKAAEQQKLQLHIQHHDLHPHKKSKPKTAKPPPTHHQTADGLLAPPGADDEHRSRSPSRDEHDDGVGGGQSSGRSATPAPLHMSAQAIAPGAAVKTKDNAAAAAAAAAAASAYFPADSAPVSSAIVHAAANAAVCVLPDNRMVRNAFDMPSYWVDMGFRRRLGWVMRDGSGAVRRRRAREEAEAEAKAKAIANANADNHAPPQTTAAPTAPQIKREGADDIDIDGDGDNHMGGTAAMASQASGPAGEFVSVANMGGDPWELSSSSAAAGAAAAPAPAPAYLQPAAAAGQPLVAADGDTDPTAPRLFFSMMLDSGATLAILQRADFLALGVDPAVHAAQSMVGIDTANGRVERLLFELHNSVVGVPRDAGGSSKPHDDDDDDDDDDDGDGIVELRCGSGRGRGRHRHTPACSLGAVMPVVMSGADSLALDQLHNNTRLSGMLPFKACYAAFAPGQDEVWLGSERKDVVAKGRVDVGMRWPSAS